MAGESAARAVIQDLVDGGAGPGKILQFVGRGMGAIGEEVGAAATVGAAPEVVTAGEEAGVAFVEILGWWLLLILLVVLLLIRWFEGLILRALGSLWIVGGPLRRIVGAAFSILDGVEDSIIHQFENAGKSVLFDLAFVVLIVLGLNPDATRKMLSSIGVDSRNNATQAQINHLQGEIDYLKSHMTTVQQVTVNPTQTTGVPANLWTQVHQLQDFQHRVTNDLTDFDTRIRKVEHLASTTAHQMSDLATQVHDVRAVSAGWQDIQLELQTLANTLTSFANSVEGDLRQLHHHQAQMAPLGMLLQPGLAGLRNLRKLEDNPCQCPKLPGMDRQGPEWLALYQFMTYG